MNNDNALEEARLKHHIELSEDALILLSSQAKSSIKAYQWATGTLISLLMFSLGWLASGERFATTIAVNSHRITAIEQTYPKEFDKFNDLLISNGTKLDMLSIALKEHELTTLGTNKGNEVR